MTAKVPILLIYLFLYSMNDFCTYLSILSNYKKRKALFIIICLLMKILKNFLLRVCLLGTSTPLILVQDVSVMKTPGDFNVVELIGCRQQIVIILRWILMIYLLMVVRHE